MPYQAGFQPQGVRRDRSDVFLAQRHKCSEARKLDEGRLARRLEKVRPSPLPALHHARSQSADSCLCAQLVTLHFPPEDEKGKASAPAKSSPLASLSSLGDSLRGRTAKELWRTAVSNVDVDVERGASSLTPLGGSTLANAFLSCAQPSKPSSSGRTTRTPPIARSARASMPPLLSPCVCAR